MISGTTRVIRITIKPITHGNAVVVDEEFATFKPATVAEADWSGINYWFENNGS